MTRLSTALSKSLLAGMFFFAGLLAAGAQNNPAPEQGSTMPNALQGFARNRNEPIKIDASRLEVHDEVGEVGLLRPVRRGRERQVVVRRERFLVVERDLRPLRQVPEQPAIERVVRVRRGRHDRPRRVQQIQPQAPFLGEVDGVGHLRQDPMRAVAGAFGGQVQSLA